MLGKIHLTFLSHHMKKYLFKLAFGLLVIGVPFGVYLCTSNFWDNRNPWMKEHMWEVTRAWTGAPELPTEATHFQIQTSGDPWTRKFVCSFEAPNVILTAWLKQFPDIELTEKTDLLNGSVEYVGKGRQGATYYKLNFNPEKSEVHLMVSWN